MLDVAGVSKRFATRGREIVALRHVDLTLRPGETVGCIGESGSGKSTLARIVAGLETPTTGTVSIDGVQRPVRHGRATIRPDVVGMIFQDPYGSLPPRMRIGDALEEPLMLARMGDHGSRHARVLEYLDRVGLPADTVGRLPRELSGGQRQRVCIARALIHGCRLLIADEPVAALDVSVQAHVVNLLVELQRDLGFAMLFISHDLRVVRYVSDRMLVLYHGLVMEEGAADQVLRTPANPYTQLLLSSLPGRPVEASTEEAAEIDVLQPIAGCPFAPSCQRRSGLAPAQASLCEQEEPARVMLNGGGHSAACHWIAQ